MNNKDTYEKGFSAIELILALALVGVIMLTLSNVHLTSWDLFSFNTQEVDISKQAIRITQTLNPDIRRSSDFKVANLDGTSGNELALKTGADKFVLYGIKNNKLVKINPRVGYGINNNWPDSWDFLNPVYISEAIILDYNFSITNRMVSYRFNLKKEGDPYILANNINSRVTN